MFEKYYNPLCNFAFTIVKDKKTAQDAVQDVFAKLWAKKDEITIKTNEKSYLFTAVKNRSLEILRKEAIDAKVNKADYNQIADDVDEEASKYMLKEKLYNSIRQLPPKCQEIFVLTKVNGLTYAEVAEELNISVKTVENQIGKGYRKLRILMTDNLSNSKD